MKKLLVIMVVLVIAITLSGCDKAFPQDIYYTQDEVDNMITDHYPQQDYVTQDELDEMFTDYGLDIHSAEDLVNLVDDLEDIVEQLELRIAELE